MKNTLKSLILFLIVNFANAQKITVNADKYTIKGVGSKQTKFYTNKAFFNTLIVGDTASSQSDPFRITTNARFDGRISIGGSYGTAGTYLRSSGNSSNPTWGAIDWSEIVNKPVFGNYLPLSGGIMTGYLTLSNSIRLGGVFENTWFGKNALISNTSGSSNVAIGNETLTLLSSHNYNVAVGATALKKVTASANTAIGGASMNSTTTGGYNVAVGISSLANNLTGSYNVAVGPYAGQYLLGTGNAIFGGYSATSERTRQNSMFLGNGSGGLYIFGDSLANIGLGTTRPKTKLQINYDNSISYISNYPSGYGNIHLQPLGSGSTGISFGANTTSGGTTNVVNAGIHVASNVSYGTRMRFSTSNNLTNGALSRMIIDENGKVGIGNDTPAEMLDVTGNGKVSGNLELNDISDVRGAINSKLSSSDAASIYSSLSGNNNFTGSNIFLTPVFRNSTSTSSFSSMTPEWTNTGNLGTFRWRYNTKVGSNTVTWYPLNIDTNGWVGIGMQPTQAFEVLGAAKFNSGISTTTLGASGAINSSATSTFNGVSLGASDIRSTSNVLTLGGTSERVRIDANGNFGVGTTLPTQKLSVLVSAGTEVPSSGSSGGHLLLTNGSYGAMFGVNSTGNTWIQASRTDGTATNYNLLLNPNGGNIGVGTTNPTAPFQIQRGNAGDEIARFLNANGFGLRVIAQTGGTGTNSAISAASGESISINPNNAEAFRVLVNGNTGIGTTNPTKKLEIANAGEASIRLNNTSANSWDLVNTSSSGSFQLVRGGSNVYFHIGNTGNIGIGTTSPVYKLDVNGTTSSTNFITPNYFQGTGTNPLLFTFNGNQDIWSQGASGIIRFIDSGYSNVNFSVNQSGNGYFRGNLGVGTTSPTSQLHIKSVNPVLRLEGSTTSGYLDFNDTRMNLHAGSGYMSLVAGTVERMRISADGNVGIGTTSPARKLEVNGSVYVNSEGNGFVVDAANLSRFGFIKYSGSNAAIAHGNTVPLVFGQTDNTSILSGTFTEQMRIDLGGNVGIGVSNPQKKLDVSDVIRSSNNFAGFELVATTGTSYRWTLNNDNGLYLQSSSDKFVANAATRIGIGATGNVGIGTESPNAPLQLANTVVNRKIVLYEDTNNDHQYFGFGINNSTLRYQVNNPLSNHVFYAGTGTTTSQQLLSINGDQTVTYTPLTTAQINALTKVKGKMAYNSDTDKPVWCNGTVWRYADGTNM